MSVSYIANSTLYHSKNGKFLSVPCGAIENYKKNLDSIKRRKEWKTTGVGAEFMGVECYDDSKARANLAVTDIVMLNDEECIYTARLDDSTAIYKKSLIDLDKPESVILRKENLIVHNIDQDPENNRLVLSSGLPYDYECHISILYLNKSSVSYVTEGECIDSNPIFHHSNPDIIYYDSCGYGFDAQGRVITSPREICKLNISTGSLETILSDESYDYFKPQIDQKGDLYCLKRPCKDKVGSGFANFKNLLLAPAKIFRAIVGWLDFFTQRYSGESLKSSGGHNPAKSKQKSAEEVFIEGNLIKVQNNLDKNKQAGDKYPGTIPKNWELIKISPDGNITTIKTGVLSFLITKDEIFYSNGKYLLSMDQTGQENMITEDKLINKICSFT